MEFPCQGKLTILLFPKASESQEPQCIVTLRYLKATCKVAYLDEEQRGLSNRDST